MDGQPFSDSDAIELGRYRDTWINALLVDFCKTGNFCTTAPTPIFRLLEIAPIVRERIAANSIKKEQLDILVRDKAITEKSRDRGLGLKRKKESDPAADETSKALKGGARATRLEISKQKGRE